MKVAVVSDIHANRQAFEAVLEAVADSEAAELWCLGDIVGYGADPDACVELARRHVAVCLAGNHDMAVVGELPLDEFSRGASIAAQWTREVIAPANRSFLACLRPQGQEDARDGAIGLYHASPRDPVWEYVLSALLAELCLDREPNRICLIGHSHVASDVYAPGGRGGKAASHVARAPSSTSHAANGCSTPGSVGQPRDGDRRAAWLLLDLDGYQASYRRTSYDVAGAGAAIKGSASAKLACGAPGVRSMNMRILIRLIVVALLGAAAALLVSCGSSGKGLIPSANGTLLQADFEEVAKAAEAGNGSCAKDRSGTWQDPGGLPQRFPPTVDKGLHKRLGRRHERTYAKQALAMCQEPTRDRHFDDRYPRRKPRLRPARPALKRRQAPKRRRHRPRRRTRRRPPPPARRRIRAGESKLLAKATPKKVRAKAKAKAKAKVKVKVKSRGKENEVNGAIRLRRGKCRRWPVSDPEIAGRYRLQSRLGFGGMSTVHLAFDKRLERRVAVKLLAEHLAEDPTFVSRFQREAQAAARLIHPNIVQVFDSGQDERTGQYFIVMEYIEGQSCAEILRDDGWVEVDEAVAIIEQACEGLHYAHRHGVVHRDVKPGNLLRSRDGEVKLADFGIAKATEQSSITQVGSVLGTAAYLAPEQARGEEAGPRADLYALGVVTYQLISGRLPYEAASLTELALKQQQEEPAMLDTLVAAVTPELAEAVGIALALDPRERYETRARWGARSTTARSVSPPTSIARRRADRARHRGDQCACQRHTNAQPLGRTRSGRPRQPRRGPAREAPPVVATAPRSSRGSGLRRLALALLALLALVGVIALIAVLSSPASTTIKLRDVFYERTQESAEALKQLVNENTK